jgi:cytochrome P450
MFYLSLTLFSITCLWGITRIIAFVSNRSLAKQSGLLYTYSLVTELESWAYLTDPLLRKLCHKHVLSQGKGWPKWARFMIKDWMYEDKYRAHEEFGDIFLVVSPGGIICYVAEADAALDVCLRRRDFIKPREKMKMIEPFGPNVVSSEGDLWRFHYRITATPFGDAVNSLVWNETQRQTSFLKLAWAKNGINSVKSDIYSVGVNVMASAGFGRQQDWQADKAPPPGHELTLVDSIYGVVTYLPLILLLPRRLLRTFCEAAHVAYSEFERYMRAFIEEEKLKIDEQASSSKGKLGRNLLTTMLATNASEEKTQDEESHKRVALTDDEVLGNIFMFFMVASCRNPQERYNAYYTAGRL